MDSKTRSRLMEMAGEDGSLYTVEQDVLNIVEKIQNYDENLTLKYCPQASLSDPPYRLFETCRDGVERKVLDIWELDERVLERLHAADNARTNVLLALDGHNKLIELNEERRYKEEMLEAQDIMVSYLKTPKGRYSIRDPKTGNKITLDDQRGIPARVERQ